MQIDRQREISREREREREKGRRKIRNITYQMLYNVTKNPYYIFVSVNVYRYQYFHYSRGPHNLIPPLNSLREWTYGKLKCINRQIYGYTDRQILGHQGDCWIIEKICVRDKQAVSRVLHTDSKHCFWIRCSLQFNAGSRIIENNLGVLFSYSKAPAGGANPVGPFLTLRDKANDYLT